MSGKYSLFDKFLILLGFCAVILGLFTLAFISSLNCDDSLENLPTPIATVPYTPELENVLDSCQVETVYFSLYINNVPRDNNLNYDFYLQEPYKNKPLFRKHIILNEVKFIDENKNFNKRYYLSFDTMSYYGPDAIKIYPSFDNKNYFKSLNGYIVDSNENVYEINILAEGSCDSYIVVEMDFNDLKKVGK